MKEKSNKYPRILIISNNSFSDTTNNGKTLASFFDRYPADNIAQLYFNPELPSNTIDNYFRITDTDIVRSFLDKNYVCGKRISQDNPHSVKNVGDNGNFIKKIKDYELTRIAREIVWKSKRWKTSILEKWLEDFKPEIIFFCAGDSAFAYDITSFIRAEYNAKLIVYITDDYILPRKTISPFWWLRRNYIIKKMRKTVQSSDLFITISQPMRDTYRRLFNKDSILAMNMSGSMRNGNYISKNTNYTTFVYTGGLHFKRYETLSLLARSIKKFNENHQSKNHKIFLKIYSGQKPNSKILNLINIDGASQYLGKLDPIQLKEVLNSCDIPVHVESFDNKSIESTRLSISTKIPEYLSLGKPVLAIGPSEVASIKYLQDVAFCITDKNNIYSNLSKLLNDVNLCEELSKKSLYKYKMNHDKNKVSTNLIKEILNI